jgi:predicted O-linked N-acetylglucosamine transferase (SPINDLY family)
MAVFDLLASNVPQRGHRRAAGYTWNSLFGQRRKFPAKAVGSLAAREKIKVAFLSHDFRMHAGGTLVVGLLEHLPADRIEWWAYCNSFGDKSDVRKRARSGVDRFVNVSKLNDSELAEKIQEDDIDIVIDLNGMTSGCRIGTLAHHPAPIQVVWKGMPGSIGAADDVGYIIGDAWVIDAENRDGFAENVIQLPRAYQPNDHQRPDLDLAGSRADHKLPDDAFVFASFNQHYKISPDNFELWCRMLTRVPDSVLWLMAPKSPELVKRLQELCGRHGVDPERLIFGPILKHEKHVARLTHADLILDTWPYNAHTTCSDALRAGTPVLTVPGRTFAARVAASVLDTAGLNDWIRRDGEDYVETAVRFAGLSRSEIEAEKQRVYAAYWSSPMVDNAALGRQFEAMCLELYRVAAGEAPRQDLAITEDARVRALDEFGVASVAE